MRLKERNMYKLLKLQWYLIEYFKRNPNIESIFLKLTTKQFPIMKVLILSSSFISGIKLIIT